MTSPERAAMATAETKSENAPTALGDNWVADLTAWAAGRPPEANYRYNSITNCALAQYLRATGNIGPRGGVGGIRFKDASGQTHYIPEPVRNALGDLPTNFGALHKRLTALATPQVPA